VVAPAILTPFRRHWNASGGVPVAVTLNEAVAPANVVKGCGGDKTIGAAGVTVSIALELFVVPAELLTSTENDTPFSAIDTAEMS
jgi:hypothetical protein